MFVAVQCTTFRTACAGAAAANRLLAELGEACSRVAAAYRIPSARARHTASATSTNAKSPMVTARATANESLSA